ncbi:MAG: Dabb family protein [Lachnospiraceae bacterium]|nr:Dabb family protein [Lachnospiraceae bacterium]
MVKHIILWKIKEEKTDEEKVRIRAGVKEGLESLKGKVPGLVEIHVITDGLASSNADVMLDSTFETEEALKGYAVHPEHVKVADNNVRPFMEVRMCMDYEMD